MTGLGCSALSGRAVRGVFRLKGRDARKPLILFVASLRQAGRYAGPLSPRVRALLRRLWPGAFTAVLRRRARLPRGVGRAGTVGVRMPRHPVPLGLVRRLGAPLATTSANLSGKPTRASTREAGRVWGAQVAVLAGRSGRVPSTVADLTVWPPKIIREGAISGRALGRIVERLGGKGWQP